jgi:hypothetical protein
MPIVDTKQTPDRKFSVFIEDQDSGNGGIKHTDRLVPQNFRKQARGLGGASFRVLRSTEHNKKYEEELRTLYGRKIWICDTSLMSDPKSLDSPGCILWYGTIKATTIDILQESSDFIGYVSAEEIGYYYASQPKIRSKRLPPFNPFLENEGRWVANKKKDELVFENAPTKFLKVGTTPLQWSVADQDYVWSRAEVIQYLINEFNGMATTFPDELDANGYGEDRAKRDAIINQDFERGNISAQRRDDLLSDSAKEESSQIYRNKEAYEFFYSKKYPNSFDSFENKSIDEILNALLQSPFDWFYDYNTSFEVDLVIYNKSTVNLPGVCPAAYSYDYSIPTDKVTNLNLVKDANEVYDRVTLRGNRMLWCGGLTAWDTSIYNTLEKDWKGPNELVYVVGKYKEDGTPADEYETDLNKASAVRQIIPKVYTHLKFKANNDTPECWVQVSKNQGNITTANGGEEFRAFFGTAEPFTLNKNGQPEIAKDCYFNLSPSAHKTPYKYSDNWTTDLPFKDNSISDDSDLEKFKSRYVIAKTLDADGNQVFIELTKDNGLSDIASLNHYSNGVIVSNTIREVAAQDADEFWMIEDGGTVYNKPTVIGNWEDAVSSKNPATNASYKGFTHWGTYEVVIAGYSDQYLECTILRPNASGSKTKLIEDSTYEFWVVHPNTPKSLGERKNTDPNNWSNRVERFEGTGKTKNNPVILKNDAPELLKALYAYSNWLFQERRSAKIDYALMLYNEGLGIGTVFKNLNDGSVKWSVNSSIESIEWDLSNPDAPRVYVSTSFPEIPQIKRMETTKISSALPQTGPLTDYRASVITQEKKETGKVKNSEELPPPRTLGVGGGDTGINAWVIIRGQEMLPSGYYGIKKLAELPEDVPDWFEDDIGEILTHNTFPDGLGIMRNVVTGNYQKVINVSGLSFLNGDAPTGSVYGLSIGNFVQIKVAGTGTSESNPPRYVQFASIIYGR